MSDKIKASDGRRPEWYWCENKIMSVILSELGPFGCAVYTAIAIRANSDREAWPGLKRLAKDAGMSERKAQQVVLELCRLGVLEVEERQTDRGLDLPRIYRLITPSETGAQDAPVQVVRPIGVHAVPVRGAHGASDGCTPCAQTRLKEQETREQDSTADAVEEEGSRTRPAPKPSPMRRSAASPSSSSVIDLADEMTIAMLESCGLDPDLTRPIVLVSVADFAGRLRRRNFTAAEIREAAATWHEFLGPDRDPESIEPPRPQQLAEWVARRRAAEAMRKAGSGKGTRAAVPGPGRRSAAAPHGLVPHIEY